MSIQQFTGDMQLIYRYCINSDMTEQTKRMSDPVLAELLQMVTETHGILKSHMHDHDLNHQILESKLEAAHTDILLVRGGFPGDDPTGHRMAHEEDMRRIKARSDFWQKMSFEIGKYGLLGFLGWACYALWNAFLHGPGK